MSSVHLSGIPQHVSSLYLNVYTSSAETLKARAGTRSVAGRAREQRTCGAMRNTGGWCQAASSLPMGLTGRPSSRLPMRAPTLKALGTNPSQGVPRPGVSGYGERGCSRRFSDAALVVVDLVADLLVVDVLAALGLLAPRRHRVGDVALRRAPRRGVEGAVGTSAGRTTRPVAGLRRGGVRRGRLAASGSSDVVAPRAAPRTRARGVCPGAS